MPASRVVVPPILQTEKVEYQPATLPPYPTNMKLSVPQHMLVSLTTTFGMVTLSRPIVNLQSMYFLSFTPDRMSQKDKSLLFWQTLGTTKWMQGAQPFMHEWAAFAGLLVVNEMTQDFCSSRFGWPVHGFASGILSGLAVTAVRHPYDVLRATAEHPGAPVRFKGPWDVLVQTAKKDPKFLSGLYKGGSISALANSIQWGLTFGTWEMLKYDGAEASLKRTLVWAYISVVFGHTMQYPVHFTNQALHEYNRTKRFGGVTVKRFLLEQRKRTGLTVLWTGFFASKPLIGCVPGALVLTAFDYGKRWLWKQQTGGQ